MFLPVIDTGNRQIEEDGHVRQMSPPVNGQTDEGDRWGDGSVLAELDIRYTREQWQRMQAE